jgi:hypothetical protein
MDASLMLSMTLNAFMIAYLLYNHFYGWDDW